METIGGKQFSYEDLIGKYLVYGNWRIKSPFGETAKRIVICKNRTIADIILDGMIRDNNVYVRKIFISKTSDIPNFYKPRFVVDWDLAEDCSYWLRLGCAAQNIKMEDIL